jgi:tRNA-splicing ligase RtcB (3'-phosphate/5'-hydroxy nucleic acid ligase)
MRRVDFRMKANELKNLGIRGAALRVAQESLREAAEGGMEHEAMRERVRAVVADPAGWTGDPVFGKLAVALGPPSEASQALLEGPGAPWRMWGEGLEAQAVDQMKRACQLPVSVAGALMPDAHVGYGLPIGGVLATEGAVVPYAVGVDIACRMRLSVLDLPAGMLESEHGRDRLAAAIERQTRFGVGANFKMPREHGVIDRDWSVTSLTRGLRDKAWKQLGTSGSGNHFVEFGVLTVTAPIEAAQSAGVGTDDMRRPGYGSGAILNLKPGTYLSLLSHSGSRGSGAAVCDHYSRVAMALHPDLPKELKYLAWLGLDTEEGQEYWAAMNLMGEYAAANHEVIHREVLKDLGAERLGYVENHHNFAWKETHDLGDGRGPREVIVHRKGATPAGEGVLGVIPGSMATPGYVVRGKGGAGSLRSASHGAGRVMSRTAARSAFAWGNVKKDLAAKGITLLSAGIDEVPGVYKDIKAVMAAQQDLVEVVAQFDPKLVKMAPEGEKAED